MIKVFNDGARQQSVLLAVVAVLMMLPAAALAHQLDSVGEYRVEIAWQYEPAISGEPNGIYLWVSPLDPSLPVEEQPFRDGIEGLRKDLRLELVFKQDRTTLPLSADHDVPGKYYALVSPTEPGYYQVNILGKVGQTDFNKALHAPKVENSEFIRFPAGDQEISQLDGMEARLDGMGEDLARLEARVSDLQATRTDPAAVYALFALAVAAVSVSGLALYRRR